MNKCLTEEQFKEILVFLEAMEITLRKCDGYDDCCVGLAEGFGSEYRLTYSRRAIIEKMMERDGMCAFDAMEYFQFNIIGAYLGEGMPLFLMEVS